MISIRFIPPYVSLALVDDGFMLNPMGLLCRLFKRTQLKSGAEPEEDGKPTLQNWKMPGSCTKTQTKPQPRFPRLPALEEGDFLPISWNKVTSQAKFECHERVA